MILSVGLLVDGQRAAHQRLGVDKLGLAIQKNSEIAHEPCRRICNASLVCKGCSRVDMWCERVECGPGADILWVADEGVIQPAQRASQGRVVGVVPQVTARDVPTSL